MLDENGVEEKRTYNHQYGLEQFKQDTKRKYDTDIGPLIKEETMTWTKWDTKEEKIQQECL